MQSFPMAYNGCKKEEKMKKIFFVLVFVFALFSSAFAQSNWVIDRDGDEIRMKNRFDPDPSKTYRGTIDKDGSVRMRNPEGDRLRGDIDKDGYGRLRNDYGNTIRVRPR